MKRLYTFFSLVSVLAALAVPAAAFAKDEPSPAPAGRTWDAADASPTMNADGWTWDEM